MGVQSERQTQAYRARPAPGQLVEVRRRQWVVADIDAAGLSFGLPTPQHCVTLSSIDEDGLGEELEVIWEIEPGAQVIERAGLPSITGQDDSDVLDAFLDAVRWGAATNADRGSSRLRSEVASASRTFNSIHWSEPSTWLASIFLLPTMSASARPSRLVWSFRSYCCGIAPARY